MEDFLYLLTFVAVVIALYASYSILQIIIISYRCRTLTRYLRKCGFKTTARARKQIVYTKEISKEDLQSRMNRWGIKSYSLLDNVRYYECITVTERKIFARSYLKYGQFYPEDYESGYIMHHYYRMSKFINGEWLFRKKDYLKDDASNLEKYIPTLKLTDTEEKYSIACNYVNKSSLFILENEIEFWRGK